MRINDMRDGQHLADGHDGEESAVKGGTATSEPALGRAVVLGGVSTRSQTTLDPAMSDKPP